MAANLRYAVKAMNPQQQLNLHALAKLVRLLDDKHSLTIKQIAKRLRCTYAGASRRIDILLSRGCLIKACPPEGSKRGQVGAPPWTYRLVANRASRKIVDAARLLP